MQNSNYATLIVDRPFPSILQISLNRPAARNAINALMMQELLAIWEALSKDQQTRCVILTGIGTAFCAGADLKERQHISIETWQTQRQYLEKAMLVMVSCPMPIIAAVNGAAFGGGLELLLACDFAYAAHTATFAQSEVKMGLMPGAMGTQNLPRAAGLARAKELTFTAATFSAEQALMWGIINKMVEPDALLSQVYAVAETIADNAPLAIRQAKQALNVARHTDLKTGFKHEVDLYQPLLSTQDREEGIRAFNEKRKPQFQGK